MIRRTLVVALVVQISGTALADTVVLKNGRRIEGKVVNESDKEVAVETRGGLVVRFERKTVASIEKDEKPPNPVKEPIPEDLGVPDGASDDEVELVGH